MQSANLQQNRESENCYSRSEISWRSASTRSEIAAIRACCQRDGLRRCSRELERTTRPAPRHRACSTYELAEPECTVEIRTAVGNLSWTPTNFRLPGKLGPGTNIQIVRRCRTRVVALIALCERAVLARSAAEKVVRVCERSGISCHRDRSRRIPSCAAANATGFSEFRMFALAQISPKTKTKSPIVSVAAAKIVDEAESKLAPLPLRPKTPTTQASRSN